MFAQVDESELQWLHGGWKSGLPPHIQSLFVFGHPESSSPRWKAYDPAASDPYLSLFRVYPGEPDGGSAPSPLQRATIACCVEEFTGHDPGVNVVAYWGRPDLPSDLPKPSRIPWFMGGLPYWTGSAKLRDVFSAPWVDYLGFVEWPDYVWPHDKSWLLISGEDAHFTALAAPDDLLDLFAAEPALSHGRRLDLPR